MVGSGWHECQAVGMAPGAPYPALRVDGIQQIGQGFLQLRIRLAIGQLLKSQGYFLLGQRRQLLQQGRKQRLEPLGQADQTVQAVSVLLGESKQKPIYKLGSAISHFLKVGLGFRLNPKAAPWWNNRATAYRMNKDYDKAIADFNEAMRIDPKEPVGFNSAAWLLSVCPDVKFRDGKKAVELATKAYELAHWKRQGYIDTLAAAYAETGNFEQAVKYQELALEDAGYQQRHGAWARKVLELYKNKKPYRED
jgi:tetratricopeptide (TPR) repeat protein